ncbi:hypothetical protein [Paraburkholderia sp. SUR17]|uniref:hypothetical protein n=1 Tax=Paraburkholderia sp. SUR17 TaxID=3034358 RepID=UPI00240882A9|nr:hypothetical protein [Paraburkholderia sp. SUR17]WEY37777.1 hypothetical protein P2869_11890 [Paraburkholderia sp. SUR17]
MALPKEERRTVEDFKARLAGLQTQRRAVIASLRDDARTKVFDFFRREYAKGYSPNQIGDKFLGLAKAARYASPFVDEARNILAQLGWKPKRERA